MFKDTLSHIYLESKKRNLSQTIFTIFTEIDEIDGSKDGYVSTQQFIDAIISILGIKPENLIDLEYLSMKYRRLDSDSREERDQVWYKAFYNDYEYLETNGLSASIYGLHDQSDNKQIDATVKTNGVG